MMPKENYTTIGTTKATKSRLDRFCKKFKIKNSEFVDIAITYFVANSINPADDENNLPKDEICKILKSVNDLKAFQKAFERDNLIPILQKFLEISNIQNIKLEKKIDDLNIKLGNF